MLAELTPEQLVEWRAAVDVVGLDDSWHQAGTIAATLNNKVAEVQAGMAGKEKVPDDWLHQAKEYIPLLRRKAASQATTGGMMTPQQFGHYMRAMNG